MKKILLILAVALLLEIPSVYATDETENVEINTEDIISSQIDELNVSNFITKSKEYSGEFMEDIDIGELLQSAISGNINNDTFFKKIVNLFVKEIKSTIKILGSILIIIIIHSILKSISDGLENKSISTITYYVQYILIVTLIMSNFADIISLTKQSIQNMLGYGQTLVPLLMTLLLTTGSITSAGVIEPIILFLINFISNMLEVFIIPMVLISTAIGIISKVSEEVHIDKISKFMKSSIVWLLGITLTLFVSVVSIDGSLTSSVDGITAKTTKAAVSNLIPVVGKILGDTVDTVIGCSNILKNAVGIVGILVIIAICIGPIIKLTILTLSYHLVAAISQPIADAKIVKLLDEMGETFKLLLGIMSAIAVMLIIGTTLVIKISNSGMMYR